MDLQEIQDKLNTLLDGTERKIVFWYDDDAAYTEEVDQLQLAGDSKVIKLTGSNSFATKLLLEHQDLTTNYLVYAPFARPEDKENSLVDIFYYSEHFYSDKLIQLMIHKTVRGELVRSKSEVIIANALHYNGLDYEYEPELRLEDKVKRPDFKVEDYDTGVVWYWEHCGMMTDPQYKKRWEDKKKFYEKNGIVEGKNLIVTYDDEKGGLDSDLIQRIIEERFDLN